MRFYQYLKNVPKMSVLMLLALTLSSSCAARRSMPSFESGAGEKSGSKHLRNISAEERMVAYSAVLGLSVTNVEETKKLVNEQIKMCKGFIVEESGHKVTARIPAKNIDNYMNNVKTFGKTLFETKQGVDITDEYRDAAIALDNMKKVRDRYIALLEKALTVQEVLSIEKELERVSLAIEKLEGQMRFSEQSVAYSIVTVSLLDANNRRRPGPIGWVFYGLYHGIVWLFVW